MTTPVYGDHSPLESLARRTSTRKPEPIAYRSALTTPERKNERSPISPLLHSRFARNSAATASSNDNNSYLYSARTSLDSRNTYQDPDLEYRYDDESIYSTNTVGPEPRESWQSQDTIKDPQREVYAIIAPQSEMNPQSYSSSDSPVPMVVVSSPTEAAHAGRTPIVRPITNNFSRPVRPPIASTPENEEQKRRVLERNATRRTDSPNNTHREHQSQQRTRHENTDRTALAAMERSQSLYTAGSKDFSTLRSSPQPSSSMQSSFDASLYPAAGITNATPRSESSAGSVYSNYSFYQLPSVTPSPVGDAFLDAPLDPSAFTTKPRAAPMPPSRTAPSPTPVQYSPLQIPSQVPRTVAFAPGPHAQLVSQTPQEYLQLGITHHEANRLKESAICFEKSAKEGGGCGVGMIMWGLTLRHGWGCEKNEKTGFKWLQRAAEGAVGDLENARVGSGVDSTAIQKELVLAIYEVGQCFFQGWGVPKDQKMAFSYYTVAARLGDPDAQCDLGFCLANGKGCKKNRKESAKWYRAAVAQGVSNTGLAWIYKEKFQ